MYVVTGLLRYLRGRNFLPLRVKSWNIIRRFDRLGALFTAWWCHSRPPQSLNKTPGRQLKRLTIFQLLGRLCLLPNDKTVVQLGTSVSIYTFLHKGDPIFIANFNIRYHFTASKLHFRKFVIYFERCAKRLFVVVIKSARSTCWVKAESSSS